MANSILDNIAYIQCNAKNHGGTRSRSAIKYLVYHYTGNDGDSAAANAKYYRDTEVFASAHYFVDDSGVVQSVGDLTTAWAVGGKKWSDCARTGGGKLYGICTNSNSISIEMCDVKRDGELMATEQTLRNAAALGRLLMDRYDIPIDRVIRHFDVTGKYCPKYMMDEKKWAAFKARLTDQEDDSMPRYNKIADMPSWARETIKRLCDKGILGGTSGKKDEYGRPADLNLSEDMLRLLVINDRAGIYG